MEQALTLPANEGTLTSAGELIEHFIHSLDLKPRSRETYRKALKQFMNFAANRNTQAPLTRLDIVEYKRYLMAHYSAATVSSYLSAVRVLYEYLEAEGIAPNIARVKGPKQEKSFRKDALTAEQAKYVLESIRTGTTEGKRNFALVNLLIRTGLRTIEAERANIEDIRQEGGESLLYVQGKGRDSKGEFVVLTEATLRPIRDYLKTRGKTTPHDPLFASHSDRNQGERLTTRSISRIVKEALKSAGLDSSRLTAHSLRHTAVTLSLLAGASIQEAQAMARHASINTTMIYAHNINRVKNAPERKIDALLG